MSKIESLLIIPAYFAENSGANHRIINCYIGKDNDGQPIIEARKFEKFCTEGIENPTYLFIGIIKGSNYSQINFTDAKEFEELFKEKEWDCLDLTANQSDK